MRFLEFNQSKNPDLISIIKEVLPIIKSELGIKHLPKICLVNRIEDHDQPTFGLYQNKSNRLEVVKKNRHPVDILRTLAHELVHYKQDIEDRLGPHSGKTGSDIENQAHAVAGVIMRHINKKYPHYLKLKRIEN
jgi:Zn-dependent peptidase ImmA (M78 family)